MTGPPRSGVAGPALRGRRPPPLPGSQEVPRVRSGSLDVAPSIVCMSTPSPSDRAALGRERLAARARRVTRIRRGVAAGTLSAFVLAWGVIAHSGSMGEQAAASTASTGSTSSGAVTDDGALYDGLGSTATDDGTSSSSDAPSGVVTRQS